MRFRHKFFLYFIVFDSSPVYIYKYKTDEILEFDNPYLYMPTFLENDILLPLDNKNYTCKGIYNINTKETIELDDGYNWVGDGKDCIWFSNDNNDIIIDSNGNVLDLDYGLSEYNLSSLYDLSVDYIVFLAKNTDGDEYTIILDKDGNRVIDPIKGSRNSDYMNIYGDYIVYAKYDDSFIVNCKTGEIKNDIYIEKFDPDSGKLLIKSDGNYYLADVSDPDTLINPFEVAEKQ